MGVRLLVMFSMLATEIGLSVAGLVAVASHPGPLDAGESAMCVLIVFGMIVSLLLTIAWFVRSSSRAAARRVVDDARGEAARILTEATDRAMALCSLDAGRCRQCGNPRTGRFCPKCGAPGEGGRDGSPPAAAAGPAVTDAASAQA